MISTIGKTNGPTILGRLRVAIRRFKKGVQNKLTLLEVRSFRFSPVGGFSNEFGSVCFAEGFKMDGGGLSINAEIERLSEKILSERNYPEREQACSQLTRLLKRSNIEKLDHENLKSMKELVHQVTDPLLSILMDLLISTQGADYLKDLFSSFIPSHVGILRDVLNKNRERIFERFSFEQRKMLYVHLNVPKSYAATSGMGLDAWESIAHSLIHPVEFVWDAVETMIALLLHKHNVKVEEPQTLLNLTTRQLSVEEIMASRVIRKAPLSITYLKRTFFPEFFNKVSIKPGELILIFRARFDHDDFRANIPEKYTTKRIGGKIFAITTSGRRPSKKPLPPLQERILKEIKNNPDVSTREIRDMLESEGREWKEIRNAFHGLKSKRCLVKKKESERGTKIYYGETHLGTVKDSELHIRFAPDQIKEGLISPEDLFEFIEDIFNSPEKYFKGDIVAVSGPGLEMIQAMELKQIPLLSTKELAQRLRGAVEKNWLEALAYHHSRSAKK